MKAITPGRVAALRPRIAEITDGGSLSEHASSLRWRQSSLIHGMEMLPVRLR